MSRRTELGRAYVDAYKARGVKTIQAIADAEGVSRGTIARRIISDADHAVGAMMRVMREMGLTSVIFGVPALALEHRSGSEVALAVSRDACRRPKNKN